MYNEEYLEHHGVKGMRWGVRRVVDTATGLVKKGKTAVESRVKPQPPKNPPVEGKRRMSNAELKSRITRMKLEQEYNNLLPKAPAPKTKVEKLIAAGESMSKLAKAGYDTFSYIDKGLKIYNSMNGGPSAEPSNNNKSDFVKKAAKAAAGAASKAAAGAASKSAAKKSKTSSKSDLYWEPSSIDWDLPAIAGPVSKGKGWDTALQIVDVVYSATN